MRTRRLGLVTGPVAMGGFSTIITAPPAKSFKEIRGALGEPTGRSAAIPEYSVERERKVEAAGRRMQGPVASPAHLIGLQENEASRTKIQEPNSKSEVFFGIWFLEFGS